MSASVAPDTRPPGRIQAAPDEPHWIVTSLAHKPKPEGPYEGHGKRNFRLLFRHASEESANAECRRLACLNPGIRYGVYAAGFSCKVDNSAESLA